MISQVPFKRRIRVVNGTLYISLPKDLIYAAKLKIGDECEFTMKPITAIKPITDNEKKITA